MSAHLCCDHMEEWGCGWVIVRGCGQRVIVPAHATPVSLSATVSKIIASLWHVLHGWVLMVPGDSSRRSVSSIVTIA